MIRAKGFFARDGGLLLPVLFAFLLAVPFEAHAAESAAKRIFRIGAVLPPAQAGGPALFLRSGMEAAGKSIRTESFDVQVIVKEAHAADGSVGAALRSLLEEDPVEAILLFSFQEAPTARPFMLSSNVPFIILTDYLGGGAEAGLERYPSNVFALDRQGNSFEPFDTAVRFALRDFRAKKALILTDVQCEKAWEATLPQVPGGGGISTIVEQLSAEGFPPDLLKRVESHSADINLGCLSRPARYPELLRALSGSSKPASLVILSVQEQLGAEFAGLYVPLRYLPSSYHSRRFSELTAARDLQPFERLHEARGYDAVMLLVEAASRSASLLSGLCLVRRFEGASGLTDFSVSRFSSKPMRYFFFDGKDFRLAQNEREPEGTRCGCGIPDSDGNQNGVLDCMESPARSGVEERCVVIGGCPGGGYVYGGSPMCAAMNCIEAHEGAGQQHD